MEQHSQSHAMVSSSDVNGEAVFSQAGEQVGTIDHLEIDKKSGRVAYAVMHFGGFMGLGADSHPIPWNSLHYDPSLGGFRTDVTEEQLRGAPERPSEWRDDRDWEERVHSHYGVANPYWI
jgi:sporulation protein YlmC with PRC-barrel domain